MKQDQLLAKQLVESSNLSRDANSPASGTNDSPKSPDRPTALPNLLVFARKVAQSISTLHIPGYRLSVAVGRIAGRVIDDSIAEC